MRRRCRQFRRGAGRGGPGLRARQVDPAAGRRGGGGGLTCAPAARPAAAPGPARRPQPGAAAGRWHRHRPSGRRASAVTGSVAGQPAGLVCPTRSRSRRPRLTPLIAGHGAQRRTAVSQRLWRRRRSGPLLYRALNEACLACDGRRLGLTAQVLGLRPPARRAPAGRRAHSRGSHRGTVTVTVPLTGKAAAAAVTPTSLIRAAGGRGRAGGGPGHGTVTPGSESATRTRTSDRHGVGLPVTRTPRPGPRRGSAHGPTRPGRPGPAESRRPPGHRPT
jgi:hypothetical protein